MQYNNSAEVYDPREEEYDIESNQGRTESELKASDFFNWFILLGLLSSFIAGWGIMWLITSAQEQYPAIYRFFSSFN